MSRPRRAAVVLTYHRVLAAVAAKPKFHDVPFDRFRRQMELLATRAAASTTGPEAYVTFDDGTSDHAMAGDLLTELGLSGMFFIITERLGQDGYLTPGQVVRLVQQGHRIGSHSVSHRHLPDLSAADLDAELINSKRFLEDLTGQPVDWLAPPGGIYNRFILDRALSLGYHVFRTMEWGYADCPLYGRTPCFPVLPSYTLGAFRRILDGRASIWRYILKTQIKKVLGETIYVKLRDQLMPFNQINQGGPK